MMAKVNKLSISQACNSCCMVASISAALTTLTTTTAPTASQIEVSSPSSSSSSSPHPSKERVPIPLPAFMENTTPQERNTLNVLRRIKQFYGFVNHEDKYKRKCAICFLPKLHCVCKEVTPKFNHRLITYIHSTELGRASNTGSLATLAFRKDSKFLVHCCEEDEIELDRIMRDPSTNKVILYPTPDAYTAAEYEKKVGRAMIDNGLTIILLDGTWSQGRKLIDRFDCYENIPRIKLSVESLKDLEATASPMRSQVDMFRICSLTALLQLLKEFKSDEQCCQNLSNLLEDKVGFVCLVKDRKMGISPKDPEEEQQQKQE